MITKQDVEDAVLAGKPCPSCGAEWGPKDRFGTSALVHNQVTCVKYEGKRPVSDD